MLLTSGATGWKPTAFVILTAAALACAEPALAKKGGRSQNPEAPSTSGAPTTGSQSTAPAAKPDPAQSAGSLSGTGTADEKPADENAAASQPEAWSEEEISQAKAHCEKVLRGVEAVIEASDPIREGECGDPAPVRLISVGRNPEVSLSPPVTVTCDLVATLARWVKEDVQPLAKEHLGEPVVRIDTMSSYSCRNAYGRKKTRLSEHGRANAVDIGGFATNSGIQAELLKGWGMTARDVQAVIAKAKAEAEKAEKAVKLAKKAKGTDTKTAAKEPKAAPTDPPSKGGMPQRVANNGAGEVAPTPPSPMLASAWSVQLEMNIGPASPQVMALAAASHLGGPGMVIQAQPDGNAAEAEHKTALFLRAAHTAACQRFGTVLGPEANEAHRNHFHLDMAKRKHTNICE